MLLGLQHTTAVLDELLCCFPTLAYLVQALLMLPQQLQVNGHAQVSLVIFEAGQS